jgi:hypothetical protein
MVDAHQEQQQQVDIGQLEHYVDQIEIPLH